MMKKTGLLLLLFWAFTDCQQDAKKTVTTNAPAPKVTEQPVEQPSATTTNVLYIHAAKGLVLRKSPGKEGEKITTLARNGMPLQVLERTGPNDRFVAEKIGNVEIVADWVKVKTHDGQEGYLFEGYLAPYPPVIEEPEADVTYFEVFYKQFSPLSGPRETQGLQAGTLEGSYRQRFADGAVVESLSFEGGYTGTLTIPPGKMTLQQAFVQLRALHFNERPVVTSYNTATSALIAADKEGYEQLTITPKNGGLEVRLEIAD
jgi:Bacterial SH3 domain